MACKAISMVGDPKAEILRKAKEIKADDVIRLGEDYKQKNENGGMLDLRFVSGTMCANRKKSAIDSVCGHFIPNIDTAASTTRCE